MIAEATEEERRAKIAAAREDETRQKIAPSEKDQGKTATKAAELFNTNRTTSPPPAWIGRRRVVLHLHLHLPLVDLVDLVDLVVLVVTVVIVVIVLIVAGYRWRAQNRVIKR